MFENLRLPAGMTNHDLVKALNVAILDKGLPAFVELAGGEPGERRLVKDAFRIGLLDPLFDPSNVGLRLYDPDGTHRALGQEIQVTPLQAYIVLLEAQVRHAGHVERDAYQRRVSGALLALMTRLQDCADQLNASIEGGVASITAEPQTDRGEVELQTIMEVTAALQDMEAVVALLETSTARLIQAELGI